MLFIATVCLTGPGLSRAEAVPLIRDTEIEATIRIYAAPLLTAAGLEDEAFSIHIVRSSALNAFVARGQRLFLTTGLLRHSKNAGQVLGVMAHEIGHISGGHLARLHGAIERARKTAFITTILGLAAGALARSPAGASAIVSGGQHVATRSFLNYSRGQEQSADQAATQYLDRIGISGKGLLEFLNILSGQEFLQTTSQDPYVRSHPLTRSRISFMENHVANSPATNNKLPPGFAKRHRRMVAKLDGFLDPPEKTLEKYKENDTSFPARYARAIAMYRMADLSKALPLVESLIASSPKNPYLVELKAQMLFENGRLEEAMKSYQKAVQLLPSAPLIRTSLAHVILEMNRPKLNDLALSNIKQALMVERFMPLAWRLAGTAYGRKKQFGLSSWSLAEYNVLIGRKRLARVQVERALKILKVGSPSWLRAQDIKNQIDPKK
ncbi:M48 family metalloprotease [bacterium]|nr:M48 family metalloprotease [bacterium]